MLEAGTTAPEIALEDTAGNPVRLVDYLSSDNVLLYFMRATTCPVCNNHVKDLAAQRTELASAHVRVLIAVPEGREKAAAWQARRHVPFTVVTGQRGTPHATVGLAKKVFGAMQQSGTVLIDRQGVVRHAHGATMPVRCYDKKGLSNAIQDLRAATASTVEP